MLDFLKDPDFYGPAIFIVGVLAYGVFDYYHNRKPNG